MKVYQNDVCGEGVGRGTKKDGVGVVNGGRKGHLRTNQLLAVINFR